MKEYRVFKIKEYGIDTEAYLNHLAKLGWTLVTSYAKKNEWLIMERENNVCSKCKK